MTYVHPIASAWFGSAATGAQNYDEFADESSITEILTEHPLSALGVEMPQWAPDRASDQFADNLQRSAARLTQAKEAGAYRAEEQVVGVYRIADPDGRTASLGLFAMVDTDQISTRADEPGRVIRNEDVFLAKVAERVALINEIDHLLSAVLLLQAGAEHEVEDLSSALAQVAESGAEPTVQDTDQAGRTHQVWAVGGDQALALADLAQRGELVVADGNHRSLAAQTAGLTSFLAVITTPSALRLDPYQRLITALPVPVEAVLEGLRAAGASVTPAAVDTAEPPVPAPGVIVLYTGEQQSWRVALPIDHAAPAVDQMDHAIVERTLIRSVLGLDPADKTIRYIGGDYPDAWLREQVDTGAADAAILIAPVSMADFVAVNQQRSKMPRKSTWFVPKARAGLVAVDLRGGD